MIEDDFLGTQKHNFKLVYVANASTTNSYSEGVSRGSRHPIFIKNILRPTMHPSYHNCGHVGRSGTTKPSKFIANSVLVLGTGKLYVHRIRGRLHVRVTTPSPANPNHSNSRSSQRKQCPTAESWCALANSNYSDALTAFLQDHLRSAAC